MKILCHNSWSNANLSNDNLPKMSMGTMFFKYKDIMNCWWSKKSKTASHNYNVTKTSLIKNKYFHWRNKMSSEMFICFCLRSNLLMNWVLDHYRCQDSLPNDNKPNKPRGTLAGAWAFDLPEQNNTLSYCHLAEGHSIIKVPAPYSSISSCTNKSKRT